jgi:hypothetical protein
MMQFTALIPLWQKRPWNKQKSDHLHTMNRINLHIH